MTGLETVFYAASTAGSSDLTAEIVADPYMLLGVSDGGAHTKFFTAGRYPTETLAEYVRDRELLSRGFFGVRVRGREGAAGWELRT